MKIGDKEVPFLDKMILENYSSKFKKALDYIMVHIYIVFCCNDKSQNKNIN